MEMSSDFIMTEESDYSKNNLFTSSNSDWADKTPSPGSIDDWSRAVVDGIDRLCCDGGVRDPEGSRTLVDLVLERPQKHPTKQRLLPMRKRTMLPSSHKSPSARPKPKLRLACEAKRCLKWSPFEDHHLRTLISNGSDRKTQRRSPTGGVCWMLHVDFPTDSWSSRMIRGVEESSFLRNKENVLSSNKSTSLSSM
jgi:hypothetical protein